jgi:2-deoxy-D-gluconate 3-dehydrogenase
MILDRFKLEGQVALVTGGSTVLGQAAALALAEAGADIALLYSTRPEETRRAILGLKRRCMGVQLDAFSASVTQLQGAVQQVSNQLGRLDIIVNCAARIPRPVALEYGEDDWDGMQLDLKAAFFLSQAAAQHFRSSGRGRIINIGTPGEVDRAQAADYAPARHNLLGLTRQLAAEWAELGINVNCIIPGALGADAEPGSQTGVQAAVVYLASAASDDVQGQALYVGGA